MIIGNRIVFGYGCICSNFYFGKAAFKSLPLYKYKIGEAVSRTFEEYDVIVGITCDDYSYLIKALEGTEEMIDFKGYILDFSKGGYKEARETVLANVKAGFNSVIYTLAC